MDGLGSSAGQGFVDPSIRSEFPGLRLWWVRVPARDVPSPDAVKARLHLLSSRVRGATVVAMRSHPVPSAYRSFYRQIGLDPDTQLPPSEQVARDRLMYGEFRSLGVVGDALRIALIETNVPIWAIDAAKIDGEDIGIRMSAAGDRLGTSQHADYLEPGRLVVADGGSIHGLLFGEVALDHGVSARTREVVLFAVGVEGVPAIHVDEALWICTGVLQTR